jgi:hypothetical protein
MSEPVVIPDGLVWFQAACGRFSLDLIEANREAERLNRAYAGNPSLDYIAEFAAWVETQTRTEGAGGAKLTPAEADWLLDYVVDELVRVKKGRRADLAAGVAPTPSSPSSTTASTPSP